MAIDYPGDRTATQAPGVSPSLFQSPVVRLVQDTDGWTSGNLYQAYKELADYIDFLKQINKEMFFGDGSSGALTVNATNNPSGDSHFSNFTLTTGGIWQPKGWATYINDTFTWNGGAIQGDGIAGGSAVGASGGSVNQLNLNYGPHSGIPGSNGANNGGSAPASPPNRIAYGTSLVSTAGNGGNGGSGSDGATGNQSNSYIDPLGWKRYPHRVGNAQVVPLGTTTPLITGSGNGPGSYRGGNGGVGGRGGGGGAGGAGGVGGDAVFLFARNVIVSGSPSCSSIGGAGGNASAGNAGGGGGGGGGFFVLIYGSITGTLPTPVVTGGAAGTSTGTGGAATAGIAGTNTWLMFQVGQV